MNIRKKLQNSKRIVIKIGTSSLMTTNGKVNYQQFDRLAYVLSTLNKAGKEIVLVSSGAMGVGMDKLNISKRPVSIPGQQAISAIGQCEMMNLYSRFFSHYNQTVGQILLTRDIIEFPESLKNVTNTFDALLEMAIIPVVNENDTVAVEELDHQTKFGDNDQLSAIVANIVGADMLIMLSDIDGFYDKNPTTNPDATLYHTISDVTEDVMAKAGGEGSAFGTGGMITKLKAARYLLQHNREMVLAKAEDLTIIFDILEGYEIGTYFTAKPEIIKEAE
ncbi:glutamate 5-kinase [Jeotgalibaca porci]|uniref:Glutamate 5-kinase n=1 Tax=Jeotgalibaca porci TaxID=1868793 RepID=A0A6G7WHN5_9LACT|nr:glutamate 5-kinase [Lactobacillales bacterium]QIK51756.1 glutamate 5-kinase [Jeotgalibaca porci]